MMTLIADFNLEDEKGRIPVVIGEGIFLHLGDLAVVSDREGNRCKAWVTEVVERDVDGNQRLVAFVTPKPGTWEPADQISSKFE